MSILIDDLKKQNVNIEESGFDGRYYIAKPYDWQGLKGLYYRIKDSFRVLIGKSRAYHYKRDEGV